MPYHRGQQSHLNQFIFKRGLIDGLIDDVIYKVSFITGAPGTPTAPNPANDGLLGTRRAEIVQLKNQIENIKSKISKSV